jgi:Tfp pilus assembly protein PilN
MSPLTILGIVWGVVTAVLVVLLIYRSTLTMHEADQLFLDDAESHMQKEQTELLARMHRIQPLLRLFGAASGLLILVMAGWFVWDVFNHM